MLWDVFGAHVVGRVQGPCCGTCSGPMLWDMFGAYGMTTTSKWVSTLNLHDHDGEMVQHVEAALAGKKKIKTPLMFHSEIVIFHISIVIFHI